MKQKKGKPSPVSFIGFFIAFALMLSAWIADPHPLRFFSFSMFLIAGIAELRLWLKSRK